MTSFIKYFMAMFHYKWSKSGYTYTVCSLVLTLFPMWRSQQVLRSSALWSLLSAAVIYKNILLYLPSIFCLSLSFWFLLPEIIPSTIHGNRRVPLRALRPAGLALRQCQISTHVWSSSDTSSIYPSTQILSVCFFSLHLLSATHLFFFHLLSFPLKRD